MEDRSTISSATQYLSRGWSVIPIQPGDKRPALGSWEQYQHRRATESEARRWWAERAYNVAVVTGQISGLIVLDVDGPKGREALAGLALPPTPTVMTGKGWHYYFAYPQGARVGNAVGLLPGVDVRGDGGYVVAPPSIHPSGRRYEWADGLSPEDVPLADCPAWLLERLRPAAPQGLSRTPEDWRRLVQDGAGEGQRNNTIAALAGHLLRRYVDPYAALYLLQAWNEARCRPPLAADEVARTVESVAKMELRRRTAGAGDGHDGR